jgi:hypothetical protein
MAREIVPVPKAEPGTFNKNRPLSKAVRERVLFYSGVESTLPAHQQTGIDVHSIRTEGDANAYVQAVTAKLLSAPPSRWVPITGAVFAFLTFFFFVSLVVASINGKSVPPDSRLLVIVVLAVGIALSASFLGGTASASGKLPMPWGVKPISFSVVGGVAIFFVIFIIGYLVYVKTGADILGRSESQIPRNGVRPDSKEQSKQFTEDELNYRNLTIYTCRGVSNPRTVYELARNLEPSEHREVEMASIAVDAVCVGDEAFALDIFARLSAPDQKDHAARQITSFYIEKKKFADADRWATLLSNSQDRDWWTRKILEESQRTH